MVWDKLYDIWLGDHKGLPPKIKKPTFNRLGFLVDPEPEPEITLDYLTNGVGKPFPHCDMFILCAPKKCQYCDLHPDWQQERIDKKVNFTGESKEGFTICPADERRPNGESQQWPGNKPNPTLNEPDPDAAYQTLIDQYEEALKTMQGLKYQEALKKAFGATPKELGDNAVKYAQQTEINPAHPTNKLKNEQILEYWKKVNNPYGTD